MDEAVEKGPAFVIFGGRRPKASPTGDANREREPESDR